MATFTAVKNKKQTAGVLGGVLKYVQQEKKTRAGGLRFVTGHNCVPQSAYIEIMTAKRRFKKMDGRQFYHFVQSLTVLNSLFPGAPALGVVKYVVKEPFSTRCGRSVGAWLGGLFSGFRFGVLYLCHGRDASHLFAVAQNRGCAL